MFTNKNLNSVDKSLVMSGEIKNALMRPTSNNLIYSRKT